MLWPSAATGRLPVPEHLCVTSAAESDLEAVRHLLPTLAQRAVFSDKAYCDKGLDDALAEVGSCILTPVKLVKGETQELRQFKKAADDLFSTAVSSIRQPIEGWFNWLITKQTFKKHQKSGPQKGSSSMCSDQSQQH